MLCRSVLLVLALPVVVIAVPMAVPQAPTNSSRAIDAQDGLMDALLEEVRQILNLAGLDLTEEQAADLGER